MRQRTLLACWLLASVRAVSAPVEPEIAVQLFSVRSSAALAIDIPRDSPISAESNAAWEPGSRHHVRVCGSSLCVDAQAAPQRSLTFATLAHSRGVLLTLAGVQRLVRGKVHIVPVGGGLQVIWTVPLEEVTAAVLATESNGMNALEAKKAMAVAIRSFYRAGRRHFGAAQFCDSTHCQTLTTVVAANSINARAARETQGRVATFHGRTVPVMYSSRCGGRTLTAAAAGMHLRGYGFEAVECEPCQRDPSDWTFHVPISMKEQIDRLLEPPTGSPERLRITMGQRLGWVFIRSNHFDMERSPSGDEIIFNGQGLGHSVGLCQWGAAQMALEGASFVDILHHYLPSLTLSPSTQ